MLTSDTVIRDLYARLNALHAHECELDLRLSQEISTALAHYGPSIQTLDGTDPLYANFMTLYSQLALRRIEQFKQKISERASYLNFSLAVREALRLLGARTTLQCDLSVALDQEGSCSQEESAQQINMVFLHLMRCSKSLQHLLIELMHALETRMNDQAAQHSQGLSRNRPDSRKAISFSRC